MNSWSNLVGGIGDSTQWDIVEDVQESIEIVVERLRTAVEAEHLHEHEEEEIEYRL